MRAGKLDRRVTLLRPGEAVDNGIERRPAGFVPTMGRFASVLPEKRVETVEALGLTGKKVINVWLRYDSLTSTVTEHWGLEYEDETYAVACDPVEIGRREGIELVAVRDDLEVTRED